MRLLKNLFGKKESKDEWDCELLLEGQIMKVHMIDLDPEGYSSYWWFDVILPNGKKITIDIDEYNELRQKTEIMQARVS